MDMTVTSATNPVIDVIAACVFILISAVFTTLGVYTVRHTSAVARFFRSMSGPMTGRVLAERLHREANWKLTGVLFTAGGPVFVAIGIWGLAVTIGRLG